MMDLRSTEKRCTASPPRRALLSLLLGVAMPVSAAETIVISTDESCEAMGVSGVTVTGERTFEACDPLLVDATVEAPDGHLELRSGAAIALEPGFSVATGGRLSGQVICLSGDCRTPRMCIPAKAVGNATPGNTCNFPDPPPQPGIPALPDLPRLALDEFTYNELFTGSGYGGPFGENGGGFRSPVPEDNYARSKGCGACLEVTGPNGSLVGMVWEIADIAAVGADGMPVTVLIELDHVNEVRDTAGAGVDVTVRPVPCPLTSDIHFKLTDYSGFAWIGHEIVLFNYTDPVELVEIRAESGHDQWYPLLSTWTNRWRLNLESPFDDVPAPNPPETSARLRITSIYGDVIVTEPFQLPASAGNFYFDSGVQFAQREVAPGPCEVNWSCGNWVLDAHETCESFQQQSVGCDTLGAGTGTAWCNPGTCEWDLRTCSPPP